MTKLQADFEPPNEMYFVWEDGVFITAFTNGDAAYQLQRTRMQLQPRKTVIVVPYERKRCGHS